MIVVLAEVETRPDTFDEAFRISREHTERSRAEPGCVSHDVLLDPEHPHRLMFVERWVDRAALDTHFAVPASIQFAEALGRLAASAPHLQILPVVPRP